MAAHKNSQKSVLTQKDAELRAQQIKKVDYKLYFHLPETDPDYSGRVEANLEVSSDVSRLSPHVFMDFGGGGSVKSVTLNGAVIDYEFDGARILVASKEFSTRENKLIVEFTHPYGNSGFGFHRNRDHADGEYYMYSDFEPYNANKAFPVFDQPDLKATYSLTVDAPEKWEVIANARESSVSAGEKGWRHWVFPTTARFSTYLFALIAGPFQKWESETESKVPLRLFARKSLAQYVSKDAEHWFQVTIEGFKYFENAFGYPYPFGKYDQILTPDYNHGAMENVGAVTFTESYAFRTEVTPIQILGRAETIIHELAHMWFGNLVTMRWWDDLWLNESFATYISNLAMSKFSEKISSADVWQQFAAVNKEWAYREDDYITTHPIVGTAVDTAEALANFDGITYGKGAAVLKQLVHFIGEDQFLNGLKDYFQKFAFKNATRTDFLLALSRASGKDLLAWENEWLKSSGTNAVQVLLSESNGKIDKLVLKQFPDEADKKIRTHRTELGLYELNPQGEITLRETLSVSYSGEETRVEKASGKLLPAFVFPNVGDYDFIHVILDDKSLSVLETSLGRVSDPLLRQMLWSTLWSMVRHAKLPAQRFAQIAMANLKDEKDLAVIQKGLEYLAGTFWYLSPKLKSTYQTKVEAFVSELFQKAPSGSSMQIFLFYRFVGLAYSPEGLGVVKKWLDQAEAVPGLKMDQERRWAIISRISAKGLNEANKLIQNERSRDVSDKGVTYGMVAEAFLPNDANKKLWWERILGKDSNFEKLSIERARRVMGSFHDIDHPRLTEFMNDSFFEILPELIEKFPAEFNTSFASSLYPIECNDILDKKVGDFLGEHPDLQVGVIRELQKKRQLYQRTSMARSLSEKGTSL